MLDLQPEHILNSDFDNGDFPDFLHVFQKFITTIFDFSVFQLTYELKA